VSVEPGDILDGRYLIKNKMAEGGMGTVFSGVHTKLGRNVAIKILKAKHVEDKEQTARFLQEAQSAADLHHRNIVDVIDVGTAPDGAPYFVMELLVGESLRDRMKSSLPMYPREIGYIIKQTLAGLGAAHSRGITHRDIKPSNIFISREIDGRELVKILDFGISKLQKRADDSSAELTEDGTVLGTPLYMSPEQAAGKRELVDRRTDIYACGVILYKALTGIHPYKGRNYNEIMHSIFTTSPESPTSLNPQITTEMEKVILKAMAKEPEDRYQSTEDFAAQMGAFMVEITQAGFVLPRQKKAEPSETPPSFKALQGVLEARRPTPTPVSQPPKSVTPVSGPSLVSKGAWEDMGGYPESSRIAYRTSMYPWLLILPFAVTLFIVGGILLILAGKYISSEKDEGAGKGGTPVMTHETAGHGVGSGEGLKGKGGKAEKAETVLITLTDLPQGSFVFIDNVLEEGNPIRVNRSFRSVKVRIEAEGFEVFETEIVPSTDLVLPVNMELTKATSTPVKKGGKKKKGGGQQLDLLTDFPE
jgi:serine/threonine protein kinase